MFSFINPYNFVPFGENNPEKMDKKDVYRGMQEGEQQKEKQTDLLSGWVNVRLDLKTPLIIPDGAHPKYFNLTKQDYVERKSADRDKDLHIEYDFLKMLNPESGEEEYSIPGSELRGMIRSAYEAVTNSCVPFLMDDKPISQRVPLYAALNRRGLLGYDGKKWVLYDTKKTIEEVVVVPVYEVNRKYYIESQAIENIAQNTDNLQKNEDGSYKYGIMSALDNIRKKLGSFKYKNNTVIYGVQFVRNRKRWDIKKEGEILESYVYRSEHYCFIRADGSVIRDLPGKHIEGKGWIQYNVSVDISRVYHVAYLEKKKDIIHEWPESSAKGEEKKKDMLYAEAYKKLKSAIVRDGVESYKGRKRENRQKNRECNFALEKALEKACEDRNAFVPVYYFIVNSGGEEIVYMSGSAAGRIAQRRKWKEILEGYTPCETKLCPACLLFGTLSGGGMKSHVRVSDAFLVNNKVPKKSRHTLQILSTPKTTAFEFYLKKPTPKATYWNFDYYGVSESDDNGNSHTNYYHLEKALPRGRKYYWHHDVLLVDEKKSNLNNTVKSIDEGEFEFKIYFDQITKAQLQNLLWVITLGENDENSNMQHKLGHARPLGYGSVKLTVTDGCVRKFSCSDEGEFSFSIQKLAEAEIDVDKLSPAFKLDSEEVECFLKMCDSQTVAKMKVDYPHLKPGDQIYAWFSKNRTNPSQLKTLPRPIDNDLSLAGERECPINRANKTVKKQNRDLRIGEVLDAAFSGFGEKNGRRYGIFLKLSSGHTALLHYSKAKKRLEEYEGAVFQVKIDSIKDEKGGKKYSVTDIL